MTTAPDAIDTHAHLDDAAFDGDRDAVMGRAVAAGVRRIINVGYCRERWTSTRRLAEGHPGIFAMYGIHPQDADEYSVEALDDLRHVLQKGEAVAVGEVGLDYFRAGPDRRQQQAAFSAQLALARDLGLPVVIHQRAAEEDLVSLLTAEPDLPPLLLHSFDGTCRLAALAVERGFLVGVGGLATKPSRSDLRDVLGTVPASQIVLETDSPYLAPTGFGSRRNEPATIPIVAERVAGLWGHSAASLLALASQTAEGFFHLGAARLTAPDTAPEQAT